MKIFLDGYSDRNLGDDLMLALAARGLDGHEIYTAPDMPAVQNALQTERKRGFDCYLKVIGSGFQIYDNMGIAYRLRDIVKERRYAPIRAVIGCNISVFINRAAQSAVRAHIRSFDFMTVRDSFSLDYIRKNAPHVRCEKYPDIVFSLPDEMIPSAENCGMLGISVMRGAPYASLAQTADRYVNETGKKTLLLCFDGGSEDDISSAMRVRDMSKRRDMIEIVKYETSYGMLEKMKSCAVILGMRFHSCVLAARMNIPFVPLAYSEKTDHMLSDIGFKAKIFRAESFDARGAFDAIMGAEPLNLDKSVFEDAKGHVKALNEFLDGYK